MTKLPDHRPGGPPHSDSSPDWWFYRRTGRPPHEFRLADRLPDPPPWRTFRGAALAGLTPDDEEIERKLGIKVIYSACDVDPHPADTHQ